MPTRDPDGRLMDWGDSIPGTADTPAGIPAAVEQFDHLTVGDAVTVGSLLPRRKA